MKSGERTERKAERKKTERKAVGQQARKTTQRARRETRERVVQLDDVSLILAGAKRALYGPDVGFRVGDNLRIEGRAHAATWVILACVTYVEHVPCDYCVASFRVRSTRLLGQLPERGGER